MSKHSIEAFLDQLRTGKAETKAHKVYLHLHGRPQRLQTLRAELPIPHQTLTSALSRLQDMGMVTQDSAGHFRQVPMEEREAHAATREQERYERWAKKGRENNWFAREDNRQMRITDVL